MCSSAANQKKATKVSLFVEGCGCGDFRRRFTAPLHMPGGREFVHAMALAALGSEAE